MIRVSLAACLLLSFALVRAEEYAIAKDDAFPPAGKAKYIAGELIHVDHVNRLGILRPDRTDTQPKDFQDLPLHFDLLPYGTLRYHGAPAALRDIPIGTHLHGWFYLGEEGQFEVKKPSYPLRPDKSDFAPFNRALRLEDDFSFYQNRGALWKIASIDREAETLSMERVNRVEAPIQEGSPVGLTGVQKFELNGATRIYSGDRFASLDELTEGKEILMNLTWATLYGPGICTEIWIDEAARLRATESQRQRQMAYLRVRGVPAMITSTTHEFAEGRGTGGGDIEISLFDGIDDELLEAFREKTGAAMYAAEPSLRTYENDAKNAHWTEISRKENPPPGASGVVLKAHVYEMLEGYRPGRIVRLVASDWKKNKEIKFPREERLWPKDVMPAPWGRDEGWFGSD